MDKLKQLLNLQPREGVKDIVDGVAQMELNDVKHQRLRNKIAQQVHEESLPQAKAGLLVTEQLEKALAECKAKVEIITKRCQATNRKFRDIEFDLEKDQEQCRYGLPDKTGPLGSKPQLAVKRITEIFDKPVFFGPSGPNASAVRQGALGDCWFLAALSAIATVDSGDLLRKLCVARNEEVGVYGFIFFRDCYWQSVIVDDFLFWSMPKFDELKEEEKRLYHYNRDNYHNIAEKNGQGLEYARSGTVGETWVPLIEKAYAKLHGDYASLDGGFLADAIEDLTGGVATSFQTADLLSPDKFWHNELQHNELHKRLFGVSLDLDESHSQRSGLEVQGLLPGHAYSVMRVHECRGKRFVIVRNPWGKSEWTGAWGDGSKEWTNEWLTALPELDHSFGNDGQFVMEYKDFLAVFSQIDRTTIFDSSWSMSWHWLTIPPQPFSRSWEYGDIEFRFSMSQKTSAVIVLSQLDNRYFTGFPAGDYWGLDFVVHKADQIKPSDPLATSGISLGSMRSVSCELELLPGEYIVLPRIETADSYIRKSNHVAHEWIRSYDNVMVHHHETDNRTAKDAETPQHTPPSVSWAEGKEETPKDVSKDDTIKDETSKDEVSTEDDASKNDASKNDTSKDETSKLEAISKDDSKEEGKENAQEKWKDIQKTMDPVKSIQCEDDDADEPVEMVTPLFLGLRVYTQQNTDEQALVSVKGKVI